MLATKLITIASAIALAMSSTTAVEQSSHLRVSVHREHHQGGPCTGPGQSPMSVEGAAGVYCVSGPPCVANNHGACPGPQHGLEWGSSCGTVASGVQGCKVNTAAPEEPEEPVEEEESWEHEDANVCSGEGETPMSVEGIEQIFCVSGQACVAHYKDGACPGPQEGLEWGSFCDKVKTGVYGCLPNGQEEEEGEEEHDSWTPENEDDTVVIVIDIDDTSCGEGETPMSVEGVETIYCVPGQACVDDFKDGACPGPQEGLEWGSSCSKIDTGVYGCTPNGSEEEEEASEEDATVVEEEEGEASQSQDASKEEDEPTEGEGEEGGEETEDHDWEDGVEEPTEGEGEEGGEETEEPTEGEGEEGGEETEDHDWEDGVEEPTEGDAEPTEGDETAEEGDETTEETTEGEEETTEAPTEAPTKHKHHHKKHHHKH